METKTLPGKRFSGQYVRQFATRAFEECGVEGIEARQAADVLCTADEWGIRSHGLARLRSYCEMLRSGKINSKAKPRILKDLNATVLIDGDNGLGMVAGIFANKIAMDRAKENGICWVSVINSNHFGIAGYFSTRGLDQDLIGFAMTNTPPLVSPFGGKERMLGTNPLSFAFPAADEPPVVIDMASSAMSLGSVENAGRERKDLPPLCIIDRDGNPSCSPKDLFDGGALLPLGGAEETGGHKGYCLASLVDILCGVFPGASWGPFVPPFLNQAASPERVVGKGIGHLFGSVWIGAFEDPHEVRKRTDDWIRTMRNSRPMPGGRRVLVPGDPEHSAASDSRISGVLVDNVVCADLRELAAGLNIRFDLI